MKRNDEISCVLYENRLEMTPRRFWMFENENSSTFSLYLLACATIFRKVHSVISYFFMYFDKLMRVCVLLNPRAEKKLKYLMFGKPNN